jgi:Flp pilus assembly protein TadG
VKHLVRYLRDEHGASTAEFVLVLPVLLLIVLGIFQFGMALFTSAQLHFATEASARCASVQLSCRVGGLPTGLVTSATVTAYASSVYRGLAPATFTYAATGTCNQSGTGNSGKVVTGAATFKLNLGVFYRDIPMTSTACFP